MMRDDHGKGLRSLTRHRQISMFWHQFMTISTTDCVVIVYYKCFTLFLSGRCRHSVPCMVTAAVWQDTELTWGRRKRTEDPDGANGAVFCCKWIAHKGDVNICELKALIAPIAHSSSIFTRHFDYCPLTRITAFFDSDLLNISICQQCFPWIRLNNSFCCGHLSLEIPCVQNDLQWPWQPFRSVIG